MANGIVMIKRKMPKFNILRFCSFTLFILILEYVKASNITLYESANYTGLSIIFDTNDGECVPLNDEWKDIVSSVKTDTCFDLYSKSDCTGDKKIRLSPESNDQNDLSYWDFDDILQSLQICDKFKARERDFVTLFDQQGNRLNLNVGKPCQKLPSHWRNRTSATKTFKQCYFYFSGLNCDGDRKIKVSDYDDFSKWPHNFANVTNSISFCYTKENGTHGPSIIRPTTAKPPYGGGRNTKIVFLSVAAVVIILLLLVIGGITVFFIYFRKRTRSISIVSKEKRSEYLSKKYIANFMQGNTSGDYSVPFDTIDAMYRAQNMPYDSEKFEIPIECLQIDWLNPLGSGEFGAVFKAVVISRPNKKFISPFEVAVKTVKAGADPEYVKALLDELKIMIYLSKTNDCKQHPYIVNLIGACTENLYRLEPYIVLELCTQGSLQNYLRKRRKTFYNSISEDQPTGLSRNSAHHYYNVKESQYQFGTIDLFKWSCEIADGMDFLASKKVIHGDLAARNVLLDEKLTVKITDFGLSKQLYQYTQYVKNKQIPLPWRWLAIEALQDTNFSTSSDVWAYGVTLYEIFTLGETPYPGIMYSPQFLASLKDGYRMSIPKYAPNVVYDLIMECWREAPDERPSFSELRDQLLYIHDEFFSSKL